MEYKNLKIIGAGGFGTIYELSPSVKNGDTVIKAIIGQSNCKDASIEYNKQRKIYDSFIYLKHINCDNYKNQKSGKNLLQIIKDNVIISKPIQFSDKLTIINNENYECSLIMSKLMGIPLSIYFDSNSSFDQGKKDFEKEYLKKVGKDYSVMGHLTISGNIFKSGFYPKNVDKKVSENNPLRGYFIVDNDPFLDYLKEHYNLQWNIEELKEIIGFIYGWIYYNANIVPIDIEIALGYDKFKDNFVINVMDFGLTVDLLNNENNINNFAIKKYVDIIDDDILEGHKREEKIFDEFMSDMSVDIYADLEEEEYMKGFKLAKEVNLDCMLYKYGLKIEQSK